MKEIVLDDSFTVLESLKHFLNFLKFSCGPPFACGSDACGPPHLVLRSKFLNHSKRIFMAPK